MNYKILLMLPMVILGCLAAQTANAGFGLTPTSISADYLMRGSVVEKDILLGRNADDAKVPLQIKMTLADEALRSWIVVDKGETFTMPAGAISQPVKITLKVPQDAALGKYATKVFFTAFPASSAPSQAIGATVVTAATFDIKVEVIDKQISRFEARELHFPKIEEGQPVLVTMMLDNTGNVSVKPSKVVLELGRDKNILDKKFETNETTSVEPFTSALTTLKFDTKLSAGNYYSKVTVYQGDKVVAEKAGLVEMLKKDSLYRGESQNIYLVRDSIKLGDTAVVVGSFKNTGDQPVSPRMVVKIFDGSKLILEQATEPKEVTARQIQDFRITLKPTQLGKYTVKAYFEYQGKVTQDVTMSVNVSLAAKHWVMIGAAVFIAVLLLIGILMMLKKGRK